MERLGTFDVRAEAGEGVEKPCPFRGICPTKWHDFTSIGTNGDKMDKECPMRSLLRSVDYNEGTAAFIEEMVARTRGILD